MKKRYIGLGILFSLFVGNSAYADIITDPNSARSGNDYSNIKYYTTNDSSNFTVTNSVEDGRADVLSERKSASEGNLYLTGVYFSDGNSYTYGNDNGTSSINLFVKNANLSGRFAKLYLYGIHSNDTLTSTGNITVTATGREATADIYAATDPYADVDAYAYAFVDALAYGIYLDGIHSNDTLTSTGNITATATGGKATASADASVYADVYADTRVGAYADGIGSIDGIAVTSTGNITATATGGEAYSNTSGVSARAGAHADADGIGDGAVTSTGDITVTATGGKATASADVYTHAYTYAYADGIYSISADAIAVMSTGNITVTATGGEAIADADADARADAFADADARAYGIYSISFDGAVTSTGNITATATGGEATAYAYADTDTDVNVRARADADARAYGIHNSEHATAVTSTGNITATATGGKATADASANTNTDVDASAYASAYGICSNDGAVTSTGNITATANAGYESTDSGVTWQSGDALAYGVYSGGGNIALNGNTTVIAKATPNGDDSTVEAYGVYIKDSSNATLDSKGLISVAIQNSDGSPFTGDNGKAYQVYADNSAVKITGYGMDFSGSQADVKERYTDVIGVSNGGSVTFDNATLYAYAEGEVDTKGYYTIPQLVEGGNYNGGDGYFVEDEEHLIAMAPDYEVSWYTLDTGDGQQAVSFTYNPEDSHQNITSEITKAMLMRFDPKAFVDAGVIADSRVGKSSSLTAANYDGTLLANTDPIVDRSALLPPQEKKEALFFLPYYSSVESSTTPMGYDADIFGFAAGYNMYLSSDSVVGINFGYGNADVDFTGTGYELRNEDIDMYSLGVHGLHHFSNDFMLSAILDVFYTENDYRDRFVANLESADFNTYGTDVRMDLSYIYAIENHRIIPRVGVQYLWQHIENYITENTAIEYDSVDEHEVYGQLGVDWQALYELKSGWSIEPSAGLGVEQVLTDGKVTSVMNGASVSRTNDDMSFVANAALDISKDNYAFRLGYFGNYNSDYEDSTFYGQFKLYF